MKLDKLWKKLLSEQKMLKTFNLIFRSAETFKKPVSEYTDYGETAEPTFYYPRKKTIRDHPSKKTYAISLIHNSNFSEKESNKRTWSSKFVQKSMTKIE